MATNTGLVDHCKKAASEKWGYVWSANGQVLTENLLSEFARKYPSNVGKHKSLIRNKWMGKRVVDCSGLIRSYLGGTGGSANAMHLAAKNKGKIETIPDIPGLCVHRPGHIGVYIGGGQVVESKDTPYGVVTTPLKGSGASTWKSWFEHAQIDYGNGAINPTTTKGGGPMMGPEADKERNLRVEGNGPGSVSSGLYISNMLDNGVNVDSEIEHCDNAILTTAISETDIFDCIKPFVEHTIDGHPVISFKKLTENRDKIAACMDVKENEIEEKILQAIKDGEYGTSQRIVRKEDRCGCRLCRCDIGTSKAVVTLSEPLLGEPIYPDLLNVDIYKTFDLMNVEIDNYLTYEDDMYGRIDKEKLMAELGLSLSDILPTDDMTWDQTRLDAEELEEIKKLPNTAGPVNAYEPYPVDNKIEELEMHDPKVKISEIEIPCVSNTAIAGDTKVASELVKLAAKTEQRLVKLENILSTNMRYLFALSSRVQINCVYYGGQCPGQKYNAIRCMNDDMISDKGLVSIDQCLSCSRYEPILGQVYDYLSDNTVDPNVITDDLQASYSNINEYLDLSINQRMHTEKPKGSLNDANPPKIPLGTVVSSIAGVDKESTNKDNKKPEGTPNIKGDNIFTITCYDLSVNSTGKAIGHPQYGLTSNGFNLSGHTWETARTVAADRTVIPMNSKIRLTFVDPAYSKYNGIYTVRDVGSAIKGKKLDFFMGDFKQNKAHQSVWDFGVTKAQVDIIS